MHFTQASGKTRAFSLQRQASASQDITAAPSPYRFNSDGRLVHPIAEFFRSPPPVPATVGARVLNMDSSLIALTPWSKFPHPQSVLALVFQNRRKQVRFVNQNYDFSFMNNFVQPVIDIFNSFVVDEQTRLVVDMFATKLFPHCARVSLKQIGANNDSPQKSQTICLIVMEDPGTLGHEPWSSLENCCPPNGNKAARSWATAAHRLYEETSCPHVLFTDQITSVAFHIAPRKYLTGFRVDAECCCSTGWDDYSPAASIACMVLCVVNAAHLYRLPRITPNRPYQDIPHAFQAGSAAAGIPQTCTSFSQWTPADMQDNRKGFLKWARKLAKHGEQHNIRKNMILKGRPHDFEDLPDLRCPVEPIKPPKDTMERVGLHMHQDSPLLRKIFEREFRLRITRKISVGPGRWSQVVRAKVQHPGSDTNANLPEVCVKLYDERFFFRDMFPVQADYDSWGDLELDVYNDEFPDFPPAVETIRQEDAAYKRMQRFQGSFLPHYYGSFMFEYDGWRTVGIIYEHIPCKHRLCSLFTPKLRKSGALRQFITDLRHAVRCMRYADLYQDDVAERNILLLRHSRDPNLWTPILIDFGRAYTSLGDYSLRRSYINEYWIEMLYDASGDSPMLESVLSEPGVWFELDDVER